MTVRLVNHSGLMLLIPKGGQALTLFFEWMAQNPQYKHLSMGVTDRERTHGIPEFGVRLFAAKLILLDIQEYINANLPKEAFKVDQP